ncbi:MAG: zinc ABC transporter substrate-binding protein [Lachnospiraceae bacterium]|nr:zinc ABC transporter substrate-binding protein [Lachnospiraceae bacterium]
MLKNKKPMYLLLIAMLIAMSVFVGCGNKKDDGKLRIVCTVYPAYDFVMNILGENKAQIEVTYLLDKGVDMHNFQPSADDIVTISGADLFIYVGGESDALIEDVLETTAKDVKAMAFMDMVEVKEEHFMGAQTEHDHEHEHEHEASTEYDEHVWLSIKKSIEIVDKLADAIAEIDSDNAADYEKNATAYMDKLRELDTKVTDIVNNALRKTMLVADRFPFAYFADDYGITGYAAFPGCSAETEASFETVIFLVETIEANNLPVIFTIENSASAVAETVASSLKGKTVKISTLDSMQSVSKEQIDAGYTYISAMEKNINALKEALN